ncbi:hypothetical protein JT05_06935 [Desulfosporosinus sp. Tol-M]|nr:hypothetical protein JT05_10240 [Desulfosporosinus sp. Tol-M]KGP76069.1 hypothetical protein JT05_06935 [Desulfosporosinus sp. Tol-M]
MADQEQVIFHPNFFKIPEDGKPYLTEAKCTKCGQLWFPKLPICPSCLNETFEDSPMDRVGTLYSYTVMYIPQPGLKAPLAIGYVDFANGLRVGAQIDVPPENIRIGMSLQVDSAVIREDKTGKQTISYVFRPAE